ncbi:hypothetical protein CY34DRAFT_814526 [Suillus luteus UH-Slu-Lm8-n1]|uniref:Uncharacterized protein n=1 Tax=Suillus luteus UH-Slu-Lm8-n1 TaxID=930992 RepID=A0A0D0ABZ6_9AGAM|nr:hypothetical protein CY34DRAFT_814526 [Suillus luteus UH-Slu-Lm8-n1]
MITPFYRSFYRSSTDWNRLSEIQGIRCCPYYLDTRFFLFLSTSVCVAVPMCLFLNCALGASWFVGVMGVGAWPPGIHKW